MGQLSRQPRLGIDNPEASPILKCGVSTATTSHDIVFLRESIPIYRAQTDLEVMERLPDELIAQVLECKNQL
jgi:hypothetical protein